ncbi:hypothetical protein EHW65_14100 [Erwinia psidii]|uniref:hypothetical protein n=1 Tax=Erwinia psidii TaxID=69224 RepID=UPI00226B8E84|nr:hypothetical protein [Erwinia psidii]MCX8958343.1 hypothetical protein [Erwinia psidii]
MELTISLSTIVSAGLGFLGVYILMPIALILRDQLIIFYINRYVITDDFWIKLRICTQDKAYFNEKFRKSTSVAFGSTGNTYTIDGLAFSEAEFNHYESGRKLHLDRMTRLDQEILTKCNLLKWINRHFKMEANFIKTIDEQVKFIYDSQVEIIKAEGSKKV